VEKAALSAPLEPWMTGGTLPVGGAGRAMYAWEWWLLLNQRLLHSSMAVAFAVCIVWGSRWRGGKGHVAAVLVRCRAREKPNSERSWEERL
jgi:hypothetical protein